MACRAIGWIPVYEQKSVGMILMSFVFPLELVATVFAFLARDTLGATTMGLFTTSWLTLVWSQVSLPAGQISITTGIYLFGFSAAIFLLALLSTLGKPFFTLLLLASVARQVLSGIHQIGGSHELDKISGGIGLGLCALALYGGTALGLEDARRREVLPLFRRGGATEAFHGFEAQLERLESEAGVRQQL